MFETRPVGLEFIEDAPLRLQFGGTLRAKPMEVFYAIAADVTALPQWYSAVKSCEYGGPGPFGVGTRRRVRLSGGVAFHERVIAWDTPDRYAYAIERTTVPGIRAMAEEWAVLETVDGTRVIWTMAIDATLPVAAFFRAGAPGVAMATKRALAQLDKRLGAR